MGFDISKFQREYKKQAVELRELKLRLERFEGEKAEAINVAVHAAVAPLNDRIREFKQVAADIAKGRDALATTAKGLGDDLATITAELALVRNERDTWKAQHEAQLATAAQHETIVAEAQAKVTDLQKLLDGVRSRMRRRELMEEQAILNRKALAGAVPQRNRG